MIDINDLPSGEKVENDGANAKGKLRAAEWNSLIEVFQQVISSHNELATDFANQVKDIVFQRPISEETWEAKRRAHEEGREILPDGIYMIIEE